MLSVLFILLGLAIIGIAIYLLFLSIGELTDRRREEPLVSVDSPHSDQSINQPVVTTIPEDETPTENDPENNDPKDDATDDMELFITLPHVWNIPPGKVRMMLLEANTLQEQGSPFTRRNITVVGRTRYERVRDALLAAGYLARKKNFQPPEWTETGLELLKAVASGRVVF